MEASGHHSRRYWSARELGYVINRWPSAGRGTKALKFALINHSTHHPLAAVQAFLMPFSSGDAAGDPVLRRCGEMPTGSAVVGDIIDAVRNLQSKVNGGSR